MSKSPANIRSLTRALLFLGLALASGAGAGDLRGPESSDPRPGLSEAWETSPLKLGMQGAVWFYQKAVSPVNPDRCGFRPSCSAYGSLAVHEHGPFWGVVMTADRLLRCNLLKKPGPFSLLLPDGKILDLPPDRSLPVIPEP